MDLTQQLREPCQPPQQLLHSSNGMSAPPGEVATTENRIPAAAWSAATQSIAKSRSLANGIAFEPLANEKNTPKKCVNLTPRKQDNESHQQFFAPCQVPPRLPQAQSNYRVPAARENRRPTAAWSAATPAVARSKSSPHIQRACRAELRPSPSTQRHGTEFTWHTPNTLLGQQSVPRDVRLSNDSRPSVPRLSLKLLEGPVALRGSARASSQSSTRTSTRKPSNCGSGSDLRAMSGSARCSRHRDDCACAVSSVLLQLPFESPPRRC